MVNDERARLAARLKEYRRLIGLTQQEVADKLNKPQTTISAWERGVTMPDANQLPEIADVLGVSFLDLCGVPDAQSNDKRLIDAYHKADDITQRNVRLLLGLERSGYVDK